MLDFLSMEAALGFSLDDYTYAEASQMFAERGRDRWSHTASIVAYIVSANSDPKKQKHLKPGDFNPWEGKGPKAGRSIKLTKENFHLLRCLATNV